MGKMRERDAQDGRLSDLRGLRMVRDEIWTRLVL